MRILALDRSDGWAFVQDGEHIFLFRPPYRPAESPRVTESDVRRAVLHDGYAALDREAATWDEIATFARTEVAEQRRAEGRPPPGDDVGRVMLQTAPARIVQRYLDRVRTELLPRGDFEGAEKLLTALMAESPHLKGSSALAEQAATLLAQARAGGVAHFRDGTRASTEDELVRRWRAKADWEVDDLSAWLAAAPIVPSPGEEHWSAAGWALSRAAERLDDDTDAKRRMRALIAAIYRHHDHPDPYERSIEAIDPYDLKLIRQADEYRWSSWAVDCLPSLYVVVEKGDPTRMFVLKWYIPPFWNHQVEERLCRGDLWLASLSERHAELIQVFTRLGEPARLANPYKSEHSRRGAIDNVMEELRVSLDRGDLGLYAGSTRVLLERHAPIVSGRMSWRRMPFEADVLVPSSSRKSSKSRSPAVPKHEELRLAAIDVQVNLRMSSAVN